ncbi:MAG: NUDIX hydrolase [Alphaproteobacteria bacterium]|jgi:8-oxo-dGTP pyrophosphatase MutT (NUDIX family)|nr:NUDIX hydrolase [Alphaproteobacteria bacterium]
MTALIPAATVLLVRDAPRLEVLMVERAYQIDFAAGALVFPGGKIAREDADPAWAEALLADHGLSPLELALRVAAIREAFEESGLLLARNRGAGIGGALASPCRLPPLIAVRDQVAAGDISFLGLMQEGGFELAIDALAPFAHWITPKGMPKRFDTHFFIAKTPADQDAAHDGHEAVDAVWLEPAAALAAAREGRRKIIFPTRLNLELLAQSESAEAALAAARARRLVTVEPTIAPDAGGVMWLRIPADAGYGEVAARLDEVA